MIRITDMTLSCLEAYNPSKEQLERMYALLLRIGPDFIEMPVRVYESLRPDPADGIILRITTPSETEAYPEVRRFICRQTGFEAAANIMTELQVNDIKELTFLSQNGAHKNVRLVGLDDVLCHDYEKAFSKILGSIKGRAEFCPEDSSYCATAAAVEWIAAGGQTWPLPSAELAAKPRLKRSLWHCGSFGGISRARLTTFSPRPPMFSRRLLNSALRTARL